MKYIALLALPVLASSLSAAVTIDDFNTGSFNFTQTGTTGGNSGLDPAVTFGFQSGLTTTNTIGGAREVRAHNTGGSGGNSVNNTVTAGQFSWSQDASTTGHFHINYGSTITSDGTAADLNADLSGESAVRLAVISSDIGGLVSVTFSMNGGASTWSNTETVPADVGGTGPASPFALDFAFAGFTQTGGAPTTFNASDVDGITFEVAAEYTSADWVFDSITAVPEPSSTALLGLGGLALIMRRRRA